MDERQREVLKSLVQMARADGQVSESERKFLRQVSSLLGCEEQELDRLAAEPLDLGEVMLDHEDRLDAVRSLLVMSFSDGFLTFKEFDYLQSIVGRLGVTAEELESLRREALEICRQEST